MAREKKFNFIPEAQLQEKVRKDRRPAVAISKIGLMRFNSSAIEEYALENRFIKLYADPQKKALAWHIFDGGQGLENLNLRKLERGGSGQMGIGVGRLLKKMGITLEENIKDLPIHKYEDLMDKKTFFYVIVREKQSEESEEEQSIFSKREREKMGL